MKATVNLPTEIEVSELEMQLAVRYDEEDIPNDFPGRKGDMLGLTVEIDTGKLHPHFPKGLTARVRMKVCDQGTYTLYSPDGTLIKRLENEYVPHGLVPGEYGDYVDLQIEGGKIINWPKHPSLKDFFEGATP
jgi:hypothetical protein